MIYRTLSDSWAGCVIGSLYAWPAIPAPEWACHSGIHDAATVTTRYGPFRASYQLATQTDKRKAVLTLIELYPKRSSTWIAEKAAVSQSTAARIKEQVSQRLTSQTGGDSSPCVWTQGMCPGVLSHIPRFVPAHVGAGRAASAARVDMCAGKTVRDC